LIERHVEWAGTMTTETETQLSAAIDTPEPDALAPATGAAAQQTWGQHPINIRMSLPLLFGRYYLTVLAGKEGRRAERRKVERQRHPLDTVANSTAFFLIGFVAALAILGFAMVIMAHGFGWSFVPAG